MKQFRKALVVILCVLCLTCLAFCVTACNSNGVDGKSAYQIWLDNGNAGTETDFLNWLKGKDGKDGANGIDGKDGVNGVDGKDGTNGKDGLNGKDGADGKDGANGADGKDGANGQDGVDGKSAYQIWLDNGNTGTETDFLNWLKGKDGTNGVDGKDGTNGADGKDGANGQDGVDGKSAYQIWLDNGNTGTETDFLNWLKGKDGANGTDGKDGVNGQDGVDGKSAYQIWLDNGNTGTETDFLNCLKGKDGANGADGKDGVNGQDGKDGANGQDGVDGKSAYQIWLDNGNTGTETDFLNWLKGKDGTNGTDGKDGANGQDGVDGKDGNGVKSAAINDKGELIITLDDGTIINAGQVVAPEKRIDENNQIICKTFEKTDKTIYGKVSNDTETFYFTDEIELKGGASYSVYKDFDCANEIVSKTVKLEVGDNTFYILEKCGSDSKFYTVTIRRREIYTVTFSISDGTPIENNTVKIEEDNIIPEDHIPVTTRDGYDLVWNFDFTQPVTKNTNIVATWTAIYTLSANSITGLTDYGKTLSVLNIPNEIDGNKITGIGNEAFKNCSGLTSVAIGNGVTSIGYGAFYNCTSLTSVIIPNSVTSIGSMAFQNCSGLTSITIPDSVTSIGGSVFYYCISLTSVTIGNSVTSIDDYTFYYCISLTSVTIGNSVTSIGSFAFNGCSGLTSVTIGGGVTSIGSFAFNGCSGLKTVFYKSSAEQWSKISIDSYNVNLTSATRYYYSETEPALNAEGTAYDGNYWHYDADGITPVIWKKEN